MNIIPTVLSALACVVAFMSLLKPTLVLRTMYGSKRIASSRNATIALRLSAALMLIGSIYFMLMRKRL